MKRWYAIHTQANGETRAARNLEQQGFEIYLPRCRKVRRHARKTECVLRPMFPRYLFVRLDPECERWRSINGTFGVSYIVAQGQMPLAVPGSVVDALRAREDDAGLVVLEPPAFKAGECLEILEGPMMMHTGLFQRMPDAERVVLLLELLGREVSVTVPRTAVAAA